MPGRSQTTTSKLPAGSAPELVASTGKLSQLLLDSAPDAMVVVDQQGKIILVNRQTEQLFGYSRNELLNKPVEVLLPERFRQRHVEHRANFTAEPHTRAMGTGLDLYARYRDGSEFPVEIMLSPIRADGQVLVSSAIRDVTERKRAHVESQAQRVTTQRQLDLRSRELRSSYEALHAAEAMATIGTVAAGVLHDLNNALFPIRSNLEALHKHENVDASQHVETIERAIDYIADLCKRMRLLMSRAEQEDNAVTDLSEWWPEVTPLLTGILPRDIKLKPVIPDNLPPVKVGRVELTQAVFNLVHNASRALRNAKPAALKIWAKPSGDKCVCIGVTDNGKGMPPDVKDRILNTTFAAEPKSTTPETGHEAGTGLGLMLVKSIVARAKGSIDIESEPGKGTTVTLVLPAVPS